MYNGITIGIILVIAGLLASPALLAGKNKAAEDMLKKIAPFQGWVGVVILFWGIWGLIYSIMNLGWLSSAPIWWATFLAVAVIEVLLGILLGFNLVSQYVLSKNVEAKAKGDELYKKLLPKQSLIGLIGIGVGVWAIISHFVLF